MVGFDPHKNQLLALNSKANKVVLAAGKKSGKTTTLINKGLEYALKPADHTVIACISISYKQTRLAFDPIVMQLRKLGVVFLVDHAKTDPAWVQIRNMGGGITDIKSYSTDDPRTLLGAKWDLVLLDEAAQMPQDIWSGYLAPNARRCLIATSPKGKNFVYDMYLEGQKPDQNEFFSINFDTFSNTKMPPEDYEQLQKEAEWAKKFSPHIYRQDFLADFLESGDNYFQGVDGCLDEKLELADTGLVLPPQKEHYYSIGVDLAKYRDFTVIAVLDQNRTLCYFKKLGHIDYNSQKLLIKQVSDKYEKRTIWVDCTGTGESVYEDLRLLGLPVEPFLFTQKSRGELLTNLLIDIADSRLRFPRIPDLLSGLNRMTIDRTAAGREKIGDQSGHLPDEVAALALAAWGLRGFPTRYQFEEDKYSSVHRAPAYDEMTGTPIWPARSLEKDEALEVAIRQ